MDVAIETSGVDRALREAIRCLRQCGTVVGVGWGSGTGAGLYLGEEFHVNRPTIVASQASSYWGNPDRCTLSGTKPGRKMPARTCFAAAP